MTENNIPKRLSLLINYLGISQRELAQRSGLTESAMCHYIKGDRIPHADALVKIAKATGVRTDWLLGLGSENGIIWISKEKQNENKINQL